MGFKNFKLVTRNQIPAPRGPPWGPLNLHCTGPLRPNGQTPHRHADGGCQDHGTNSSVLISGGEIGKRLARRIPILLLKSLPTATSPLRGRDVFRARRTRAAPRPRLSVARPDALALAPRSVVQALPLRGHELLSAANLCADPRRWFLSSLQGERRCLNTFAPASHLHTAALP